MALNFFLLRGNLMPIQNAIIEAAIPQLNPEKNSVTYNNRVWTHWRALPGFLTLTACIVAVVAALIWNSPYLCIAFGIGGLASCYLIYLGSTFHHLQSFEANNQQLKYSLRELHTQKVEMQTRLKNFETQNQKLIKTNLGLKNINIELNNVSGKLKQQNTNLLKHTDELGYKNNELDQIVQDMNEKLNSQVKNLKKVNESLDKVGVSTQENHQTFTQNLEEFNTEVVNLKEVKNQFDTIGSEVEQKMQTLAQTQIKNTEAMQKILRHYSELTDEDAVLKKVELLQNLNQRLNELGNQISRNEGVSEELSNHINDLEVIKDNLDNGVSSLAQEVTNAAEVFDAYQTHRMGGGEQMV
ncbi:MAG: hypothetical protein S4CHLAM123_14510 [Chlamydiales bacterium]|nr:hypothetical protein [Chlamydiales bacterium]